MSGNIGLGHHLVRVRHAEVNDAAGFSGLHTRGCGLCEIENRMEIAVKHLVLLRDSFIKQVHAMIGACSIDQRVNAAPFLLNLSDELLRGSGVRDVALNSERLTTPSRNFGGRCLGFLRARAVTERDLPLFGREIQCNTSPDPFGPSRDECDTLRHHATSRVVICANPFISIEDAGRARAARPRFVSRRLGPASVASCPGYSLGSLPGDLLQRRYRATPSGGRYSDQGLRHSGMWLQKQLPSTRIHQ